MGRKRKTIVYFGGDVREYWTERGLEASYTGRTAVVAEGEGDEIRAEAPEPERAGDVKAGYNELARCLELAMRLNSGAVSPLSSAYFRAAAEVNWALEDGDWRRLPVTFRRELTGGPGCIVLCELLRRLLDDCRSSWEEACAIVRDCFTLRLEAPAADTPVPLGAVAALQQRDATLIKVVNDRLCSRLWDAWPGDWQRIGEYALVRDDEADLTMLAAALCSRVYCTKEELAGPLRALYTLEPARFVEL